MLILACMLENYKNILWDFDGVILDSMLIRSNGFRKIFEGHDPEKVDALMEYHLANGGLSRFEKIRYFHDKILFQNIDDNKVRHYANRFSEIMRESLINKSLIIDDSLDWIMRNYVKFNFHIVSASEETELNFICDKLYLKKYFKSIYGSPQAKRINIEKILQENSYMQSETCLIGDSVNDYAASIDSRIDFYGYNNLALKDVGVGYIDRFQYL